MVQNTSKITGCELYAGTENQSASKRYFAHNHNWNLLLIESGRVRITIYGKTYQFQSGALIILEPGPPREFLVLEDWCCHWIHFNLDAHLQYRPEWSSCGRGIWQLLPSPSEYNEFLRLFKEIIQTCRIRQTGWYRLGYCMIQEIILRGNMVNENGLSAEHIDFAAHVLKNFDRNIIMDELANRCSLSRAVFFRKFRQTFGMPPNQYREQLLLNHERELLENSEVSFKEIAAMVQSDNSFYLSSRFSKMFSMSPREYRKTYRQSLEAHSRQSC